jgi:hypothetical protein
MLMAAILPTRAATFLADGAEVPAHALADRLQGVTCARPASNCGLISATPAGSTRETVVPTS